MLTRRMLIVGGVTGIVILPSGCLLFLARLAFRGRLLRAGARGFRRGRATTVTGFGRAAGVAVQAARLARAHGSIARLNQDTEITREEDGAVVGQCKVREEGVTLETPNGVSLMHSRRDGNTLVHYNKFINEECGRTKILDREMIHKDAENRYVGGDQISEDGGHLEHYDHNERFIGVSDIRNRNTRPPVVHAAELNQELEEIIQISAFVDREVMKKMNRIEQIQKECRGANQAEGCRYSYLEIIRLMQEIESY